ncbi:MAG: TlpA family protein disulfide reductase [Deltaproteobacteria bacterium]|nr:TlpA family protein disulfide reductase [Deltaproteobacteria bacterium]
MKIPRVAILFVLATTGCSVCDSRRPEASTAADPSTGDPGEAFDWLSLDPPAGAGALGLDLRADGEGVTATWLEPGEGESHAIRLATLEGDRWSEAITVVEGDDLIANWADFPRSARGGDDARYVHGLHRAGESPYAYEIRLYRVDGGRTESLGVVHRDGTPTEHGFVSMVPTNDGVRLFWLDGRATPDGGATAVYTTTVAETIAPEERLDERVCDCCQTDAALAGDEPLVAYRDRSADEHRDIAVGRAGARISVNDDAWQIAGCPVNGPALAADGEKVAVAWFTGADGGSVRLAFSDDGGASFGEPIVVDGEQPPGRVDVASVDDGAVVSWLARAGGRGEVRARFVGLDGSLGEPTVVGTTDTARASGFPVLARDGDRLLVGFRDGDPASLRVRSLPIDRLSRQPGIETPSDLTTMVGEGEALPEELDLLDEEDAAVTLGSLAEDGPLLVAFFARWCQPCRQEMATLEAVREANEDLSVVAVSLDEGPHGRAEGTARRWGFGGRVLRDAGAATALGVPPLPGLFLVADGRLQAVWRGETVDRDAVERALRD